MHKSEWGLTEFISQIIITLVRFLLDKGFSQLLPWSLWMKYSLLGHILVQYLLSVLFILLAKHWSQICYFSFCYMLHPSLLYLISLLIHDPYWPISPRVIPAVPLSIDLCFLTLLSSDFVDFHVWHLYIKGVFFLFLNFINTVNLTKTRLIINIWKGKLPFNLISQAKQNLHLFRILSVVDLCHQKIRLTQ